MLAKEHPDVIQGRRWLIAVYFPDSEQAAEDASIVHGDAAFDEQYGSGLVGSGATEVVRDMQKALKSSYISSFVLKPYKLLTQGSERNSTAQEKLFKYMFNFGSRSEWGTA